MRKKMFLPVKSYIEPFNCFWLLKYYSKSLSCIFRINIANPQMIEGEPMIYELNYMQYLM